MRIQVSRGSTNFAYKIYLYQKIYNKQRGKVYEFTFLPVKAWRKALKVYDISKNYCWQETWTSYGQDLVTSSNIGYKKCSKVKKCGSKVEQD